MTWPIATAPSPRWSTLVDVMRARGAELGAAPLYTFLADGETDGPSISYAQLDLRARAIAARLTQEGLRGEPVLLLFAPGLEYIAGFLGCLYAGAVAVPAYPPFNERQAGRLQNIAKAAGATFVLSTTAVMASARLLRAKRRLGKLVRRLPLIGGEGGDNTQPVFGDGLRWIAVSEAPDSLASEWIAPELTADDVAFVQYTSGSTSVPKGVRLTHANLLANLACIKRYFDLRPGTTSVSWLPPYHDMGLIGQILEPIYCGVWTYLMSPVSFLQQPLRWLRAISRVGAEVSGGPNFAYDLCARKARPADVEALDLGSWRVAFNGAEPVRAETLELFARTFAPCGFRARAFYPCYGMAESTLILAGGEAFGELRVKAADARELTRGRARFVEADAPGARRLVGCGSASPRHELAIVDPDTGRPCPDGSVGEIWARGPSIASGYWRMPEETRAAFGARPVGVDGEPFLRTGDLGFLDGAELYVTGRIKDLIIIRGRNHHPEDIEFVVAQSHPDLRPGCGAAFAVEVDGAERLVLVYEVRRQRSGSDDAVFQAVRTCVAEQHGLETHAVVLLRSGTIPKTSSGKIQRRATRAAYLDGDLQELARWQHGDEAPLVAPDAVAHEAAPSAAELEPEPDAEPVGAEEALEVARERARLAAWLTRWVAENAGVAATDIRGERSFAAYGLGSQDAVRLSGELEEQLGRKVSPIVAYQYSSIDALADYLASGESADAEGGAAGEEGDEPIAIVGLACRFPGASDPESFWETLVEGRNAQAELPHGRWDAAARQAASERPATRFGAFLSDVESFDADFFGIAAREAAHMDPQQRLLLEVAWEALERAGQVPARLAGSRTGVFVGVSTSDYAQLLGRRLDGVDAYAGTGTAFSIAANRLSYLLDLRGPSLSVDTACSSSLVAVHLALRSLRQGECDQALVGGVNLMLSPLPALAFAQANMLSPSGRCRPFDAAADGYVRGEGCGVVVLKRLADARAAGDEVLAVVRGSAVNQDGRSNGLTAPNGLAQRAVMRAALADAGCDAASVDYVEAHGTGTPLGDPIEMDSIKAVYAGSREVAEPLWVGSAKSNVGHLEAAAGITGLIKTTLALRHGVVPPHVHLTQLNPKIDLDGRPVSIPSVAQEWPSRADGARRAGVSSFGFGGTNCHVVLEQAPASAPVTREPGTCKRPLHLLALSARSPEALVAQAQCHARELRASGVTAADWAFSTHTTRAAFEQRAVVVAASADDMAAALERYAAGDGGVLAAADRATPGDRPLVFLFTGQGAQRVGLGRELYDTQPTFRRALDACAEVTAGQFDEPLLDVMFGERGRGELLGQTAYTQPALFALEWALFEMWRSWGVVPRAVLGHSVGEYVAAAAAGVWSFEEALRLVLERGRLMQALPPGGAMLSSSGLALADVEAVARRCDVDLAADNAPHEAVLSGAQAGVEAAGRELERLGARVQRLTVSHAFHSRLMDPALDDFERRVARVTPQRPRLELWLNGTGAKAAEEIFGPRYWREQLRGRVEFRRGLETLKDAGYATFVELGPAPVLTALGRRTHGEGGTWLTSLRPGRGEWEQLLECAGRLWAGGAPLDLAGFDRDYVRRRVAVPTYPFQRQRHWIDDGFDESERTLLGRRLPADGSDTLRFESRPGTEALPMLADHRVHGLPVLPTTAFADMGASCAALVFGDAAAALHDLLILQPLPVRPRGGARLQTTLQPRSADEALFSVARAEGAGDVLASARVRRVTEAPPPAVAPAAVQARLRPGQPAGEFYAALRAAGLDYGPQFQGVVAAWSGDGEALGHVRPALDGTADAHALHPALLDACFQVLALAVGDVAADATYLPFAVERIVRWRRAPREVFAHARLRADAPPDTLMGDIEVRDAAGQSVISVTGLALRRAGAEQLARLRQALEADRDGDVSARPTRTHTHPLLGERLPAVADQPGARYWERVLHAADAPYQGALRRDGEVALSAPSFAQIALCAAREARPGVAWRVAQVQADAALVLGAAAARMQVQFAHGDSEGSVRIFAAAGGGEWRLRARVRLAARPVEAHA